MSSREKKYLPNSKPCFVCGEDNPAGLKTRFYVENGLVKAPLQASPHHCGYRDTVHGGVIAALMDEAMGWAAARATGIMYVTAELAVRYLRPARQDIRLTVVAEVVKTTKRLAEAKAELVDEEGTVYARSTGKFFPLSPEASLEVDDNLIYRGDEERVFDSLRTSLQRSSSAVAERAL